MTLFIHYVPENKTWPQGTVKLICSDGHSLDFAAERKYLIYGVKPSRLDEIVATARQAAEKGSELLLTVNNGVGGYIWGIIKAEITGDGDGVACDVRLEPGEPMAHDLHELAPSDDSEEAKERFETAKAWIEDGML